MYVLDHMRFEKREGKFAQPWINLINNFAMLKKEQRNSLQWRSDLRKVHALKAGIGGWRTKNWRIYLQRYFDSADRYFNFTVCRAAEFGDARDDFSRRMSSRSRSYPTNLRLVVESSAEEIPRRNFLTSPRALLNPTFTDGAELKMAFPRKFTDPFPFPLFAVN